MSISIIKSNKINVKEVVYIIFGYVLHVKKRITNMQQYFLA